MSSKVYFSDMHVRMGDSILEKFRRLIIKAGIDQIDFRDKFVAVKLHFGEVGNMAFLRHQYARVLCDHIKERGGKPFLTVDDARGESNWTPAFFEEFQKYRGYDLRQHLPALLGIDTHQIKMQECYMIIDKP